jgi:monovalent cation/proton antiporter MnhG/PhaG subunit
MIENTGNLILALGALLIFFAAISIVRFPDVFSRANAFVKLACFGFFSLMVGIFILTGFSATGLKALLLCVIAAATIPAGIQSLLKVAKSSGIEINEGETKDKD